MTTENEKESSAPETERFVDAIENDPSAKRISDFATSPPPKDIQSIKAAADLIEADEVEKAKQKETSDND